MKKAKDKGLRGGKAVLMVDGKNVCASCRPAIMDFARSMGITEIEIHELNSGKVYVFKEENGDVTLSTRSRSQQNWQKVFELLPTIQCDDDFLSEKERKQEVATRDPFEGF